MLHIVNDYRAGLCDRIVNAIDGDFPGCHDEVNPVDDDFFEVYFLGWFEDWFVAVVDTVHFLPFGIFGKRIPTLLIHLDSPWVSRRLFVVVFCFSA
ncbi:MAG: hypothetical protein OXG67_02375, partial [bacterium]|nr:hypothetical protein [bacterium]